jgi:hypothetical protein
MRTPSSIPLIREYLLSVLDVQVFFHAKKDTRDRPEREHYEREVQNYRLSIGYDIRDMSFLAEKPSEQAGGDQRVVRLKEFSHEP